MVVTMSFVGGKLKLKGGVEVPKAGKKKSKKSKTKIETNIHAQDIKSGDVPAASKDSDRRTAAEKRFEEHQLKYEAERLKVAASKSHREKVKELNEKLSTLTEHNDLFRISYTA